MKEQSAEQLFTSLQRGMQATQDLGVVIPILAERRETLIRDAINRYNSREREYTPLQALLFVAALAENQHLRDNLEYIERAGRKAGQKLS